MLEKNLLAGKKAIITGASYGIGKALAIGFSEIGAEVGIISRSRDKLESVVNIIKEKGNTAYYEVADVSDYQQTKQAIDNLMKKMGKIDILINNAGVSRMKMYQKLKPHQIALLADVNFKGVLFATHVILPHFLENNSGVFINTSSVVAHVMSPTNIVYGATKAAVNYFTQALTIELTDKNITVNAIMPGPVETPMFHFGLTDEDVKSRNPIQPEELVPYYAFFASDLGTGITAKLVDIESFRAAFVIINSLDQDQPKTLESIIPILENKMLPDMFSYIKTNKELLKMLISL